MVANIDKYFVLVGLVFAGAGLFMGMYMGGSGDHTQMPTHAHIMLAGWVFAALYGLIYHAWPALKSGVLPILQFAFHILGAVAMTTALFFIFGGSGETGFVVPLISGGSFAIALSWLIFLVHFLMRARSAPTV